MLPELERPGVTTHSEGDPKVRADDHETVQRISRVASQRSAAAADDDWEHVRMFTKVLERLGRIARELPVLKERRDAAQLCADYEGAHAAHVEITQLESWSDSLMTFCAQVQRKIADRRAAQLPLPPVSSAARLSPGSSTPEIKEAVLGGRRSLRVADLASRDGAMSLAQSKLMICVCCLLDASAPKESEQCVVQSSLHDCAIKWRHEVPQEQRLDQSPDQG